MKKIVILIILMVIFSSLVSGFGFGKIFAGNALNFVIGNIVTNKLPVTTLNAPSSNQVVSGRIVKFDWAYNDQEGDEQQEYILQIDDDYRFFTPFTYYGLTETVREVYIPTGDGKYYWRVQSKDAYGWGKWSETRGIYLDQSEKICQDGTAFWKCSSTKPSYCDAGRLTENCQKCGCPANFACEGSGICSIQTCSDGTYYGSCSSEKPGYCQEGKLINLCSFCGCNEGRECTVSGSCAKTIVQVENIEIVVKKSVLGRIADFFKRLFGKG